MIHSLWWNNRTFDQAIHTQEGFYIFTRIAYVNDRMTDGELEVIAYVRVEAHVIDILNGLILLPYSGDAWPRFDPVQGIMGTHRTLLHYRMPEQFGPTCIVKLTFALDLEQVSCSRYLLDTRERLLIAFR